MSEASASATTVTSHMFHGSVNKLKVESKFVATMFEIFKSKWINYMISTWRFMFCKTWEYYDGACNPYVDLVGKVW